MNIEPLDLDNFPPFPDNDVNAERQLVRKINEIIGHLNKSNPQRLTREDI